MGFITNYSLNLISVMMGRQPMRPLLFSYYITHRCSLHCRYCSDGNGERFKNDPIQELGTEDAKRLVEILARSADTLDITGGEPMEREDLEEVLAHARKCKMRTVLNTKGIGFQTRSEILRFCDVLVLSLDTFDLSKLAELVGRPEDVARKILNGLDFVLEKQHEMNFRLALSVVATPDNLQDVSSVLEYARNNEIGFHISPEITGVKANPRLQGNVEYCALMDTVLSEKQRGTGVLGVPEYLNGLRHFSAFRCYPMLMPVIRPDGRLYYPCLESKNAEVSVLEVGRYEGALAKARERFGDVPACKDCCHIFCHMALSLLQRHPLSALKENRYWSRIGDNIKESAHA